MIKKLGIPYLGSKLTQMSELLTYKRAFNHGLDLFSGSAAVALNFGLEYNDLDDYVIRLMTECDSEVMDSYIKKYKILEDLEPFYDKSRGSFKYKMNQLYFNKLVDDYKADSDNIYLKYLASCVKHVMCDLSELNYGSRGEVRISEPLHKKQARFKKYIKRWHNKNFRDFDFNDYDFLFIDPPYLSSKHLYQGWNENDEKDLLNKLRGYKGRFIITNMLNEYLEAFIDELGLYKHEFITKRNSESGQLAGQATKPKEYIITNYKVGLF